jgi:crotonobetainyl-CoA:carnitine CoA-transferase CaiB-like acyl-CoA transferase
MYIGTWTASRDYAPRRMPESAHPSIVPFQAFATSDGWITIACAKQKFWERLCEALGRPDLLEDPRFADFAARDLHREELLPILRDALAGRGSEDWIEALAEAGVPCGPVYEVPDALRDRQAEARGALVELEHPSLGTVRQVASPLRVADEQGEARPYERGPFRGEHTESLLRDVCGYTDDRIAALRAAGAFG